MPKYSEVVAIGDAFRYCGPDGLVDPPSAAKLDAAHRKRDEYGG